VHVILRGGSKGPNYAAEYVRDCGEKLLKAGLPTKIMVRAYRHFLNRLDSHVCTTQIDCSHGNSSKQHQRQIDVADDIVSTVITWGDFSIVTLSFRPANSNLATPPP
jgi:3-deoxy-7-phosphoheptulonate synthase